MSISKYANKFIDPENSSRSLMETKSAATIANIPFERGYGNVLVKSNRWDEGVFSESQIATIFWQMITESPNFYTRIGLYPVNRSEEIIVHQGGSQFNLVIFVESRFFRSKIFRVSDLNILPSYCVDEWTKKVKKYIDEQFLIEKLYRNFGFDDWTNRMRSYRQLTENRKLLQDLIRELMDFQNFRVMTVQSPSREYLKSTVPSPCAGVSKARGNKATSTAGVLTNNSNERIGVTIAYHALDQPVQVGRLVFVNDILGHVLSVNEITDSCFVGLDSLTDSNLIQRNVVKGPLRGTTPRQYQNAFFEGISSGRKQTVIDSWSKDLPFVTKYNQLKVFTDLVANPGDSGAALIDNEQNILGFAFYNSSISGPASFTSWIWAESVFMAHDLKWNN